MDDLKSKYLHTDLAAEGNKIPDFSQSGARYEEENFDSIRELTEELMNIQKLLKNR